MTSTLQLFRYCSRTSFFIAVLFVPVFAFSQSEKAGSIEYLKLCNGFNGIRLGSSIGDIPAKELTYMDGNSQPDTDNCVSYVYQDDNILQVDPDLNLAQIGIRTFENKIVNIYLFFRVDDSYKILRDFLRNYGQFTEVPKEFTNVYNWKSRIVNLSLAYQEKLDIGVAVFTSNDLLKEIDKNKQELKVIDKIIQSLASVPAHTGDIKATLYSDSAGVMN